MISINLQTTAVLFKPIKIYLQILFFQLFIYSSFKDTKAKH